MPSSKKLSSPAELRYRASFERLKANKPQILSPNSPVTQNNVAREAGQDPSALKKVRFPELIRDIQTWINERQDPTTISSERKAPQKKDYRDKYKKMREQRDKALQLLVEADALILQLSNQLEELDRSKPSTNIARLLSATEKHDEN